jgi:F-type H+-transporting ATPase subunit beta
MQAVYVPADDLTDPAPATTFAHLDATTGSPARVLQGHLPGGGPARRRASTILWTRAVGAAKSTTSVARGAVRILQRYKDLQDIIAILGIGRAFRGGQAAGVPGAVVSSAS